MADFEESQRIDMAWVWLAVLFGAGMGWGSLFAGREDASVSWLPWVLVPLLGVGLPWLLYALRLTITVDATGIRIRYFPFVDRHIALSDVESFEARRYRPIREYGGWGIRGLPRMKKMAYNAKGHFGVELHLRDGRSVMLGSQRPLALGSALRDRGVSALREASPEVVDSVSTHGLP